MAAGRKDREDTAKAKALKRKGDLARAQRERAAKAAAQTEAKEAKNAQAQKDRGALASALKKSRDLEPMMKACRLEAKYAKPANDADAKVEGAKTILRKWVEEDAKQSRNAMRKSANEQLKAEEIAREERFNKIQEEATAKVLRWLNKPENAGDHCEGCPECYEE